MPGAFASYLNPGAALPPPDSRILGLAHVFEELMLKLSESGQRTRTTDAPVDDVLALAWYAGTCQITCRWFLHGAAQKNDLPPPHAATGLAR